MNLRASWTGRTLDALFGALCQDQPFLPGVRRRVTLSGGEVMCADMDMVELTRRLYDASISVMIDTCGHAPYARFQRICLMWMAFCMTSERRSARACDIPAKTMRSSWII
ncbi:MAG: hypothetical protein ACLVJ6_08845 [Merdibacter sp.]